VSNSIYPLPYPEKQKNDQVDQNERSYREIKPEIPFFDADISRQVAQPFEARAKKINDGANY